MIKTHITAINNVVTPVSVEEDGYVIVTKVIKNNTIIDDSVEVEDGDYFVNVVIDKTIDTPSITPTLYRCKTDARYNGSIVHIDKVNIQELLGHRVHKMTLALVSVIMRETAVKYDL